MRTTFYLILFLTLVIHLNTFGQKVANDTIFIRKDSIKGFAQSIFFETNKSSTFYKNITAFEFGPFDQESYKNSLDYLNSAKLKLVKQKPILSSTKWIPVEFYKGKLYAYHPCDFYTNYKVSINDTTYIDWTGEGPIANKIIYQKKRNENVFEIKTTGINELNKTILIHIINHKKGLAVFEETTSNNEKKYNLMIMVEKIKSIPFIVNHCATRKQSELLFDTIDYAKLLQIRK